jgi:cell shape-determining protein MreC
MTYLQARKKTFGTGTKVLIIGCVLVAVIFFGLQMIRPGIFSSFFAAVARPFWRTQFAIQADALKTPEGLLQENSDLKRKLEEADVRLATTKALEDENAELKSILGRDTSPPFILAAVLKRPPAINYDELIIDAGQDLGFKVNDYVFAPGNILLGRIVQVLSDTSKVKLFSSPGEKFEILIGANHVPAVAVGRGGGQYEAQLPRGMNISQGDIISVPSLNTKNFSEVVEVISDPAQPFETILIAPQVNVYQLKWVLVEKGQASR